MTGTSIEGTVIRPVSLDGYVDITDVPLTDYDRNGLLFDGVLSDVQVESIWERMTSRDDDDQAARAHLRGLVAADDPGLCAALVRYVLGDPIPEPPQT